MEPNDKIEEFFRNSLDKFDEQPSGKVWSDLDDRLNEDRSNKSVFKWFRFLMPFAFLLFAFSGIYYYQFNILKDYKTQLSDIVTENQNLRLELASQKSSDAKVNVLETEVAEVKPSVIERIREKVIVKWDTVFITRYRNGDSNSALGSVRGFRDFQESGTEGNTLFSKNKLHGDYSNPDYTSLNLAEGNRQTNLASILSHNQDKAFALIDYPERALSLKRMKIASSTKRKRKKKKNKLFGGGSPNIIIKSKDPWGKPNLYYRVGPSLGAITTLKGDKFSSNSLGFSIGIMQELGLTDRFAIQAGIYRVSQEYYLDNQGMPFGNDQIMNYPEQANYESQILSVEVNNDYYEFPIGVKYDFYQDNVRSYFISPAVKWSLFQPQEFTYILDENRFHNVTTQKRYGYLNALVFSIGVERNIASNLAYQLSLGYDQGLEPVGEERQILNNLNLKFNLMFGRK